METCQALSVKVLKSQSNKPVIKKLLKILIISSSVTYHIPEVYKVITVANAPNFQQVPLLILKSLYY